jgi:transcriptional regulator with XRE-family HTH domain
MNLYALKLAEVRRRQGVSQREMAEQLDISQSQYSKIERGTSDVALSMLARICEVLDSNFTEILNLSQPSKEKDETFYYTKKHIDFLEGNNAFMWQEMRVMQAEIDQLKRKEADLLQHIFKLVEANEPDKYR